MGEFEGAAGVGAMRGLEVEAVSVDGRGLVEDIFMCRKSV